MHDISGGCAEVAIEKQMGEGEREGRGPCDFPGRRAAPPHPLHFRFYPAMAMISGGGPNGFLGLSFYSIPRLSLSRIRQQPLH